MTKVTIDRELLERLAEYMKQRVCPAPSGKVATELHTGLVAALAVPRQPEGDGLEVRGYWREDGLHWTEENAAHGGKAYEPVCFISDAHRAIAELREECERLREENEAHLDHIGELGAAGFFEKAGFLDQVIAERDTLRQQRDRLADALEELLYARTDKAEAMAAAALAEVNK